MKSVVMYASRYGNTGKVADAIAGALREHGDVQVVSVESFSAKLPEATDLVVVGGPTEGHQMTEPIARLFDRMGQGALAGMAAAAFDTRLRWPVWLSGSAASGISRKLQRAGAHLVAPQESFLVAGKVPELQPGELERAAAWGASLAAKVDSKEPVAAR